MCRAPPVPTRPSSYLSPTAFARCRSASRRKAVGDAAPTYTGRPGDTMRGRSRRAPSRRIDGTREYTRASHGGTGIVAALRHRQEEQTSELQPLMRTSYAVFYLKKQTH